ncbi:MAG: hypothetical protein LUD77_02310 [Clostridiales bacterium]|nr:hypothetical protein [Clostridiales bacterium]
MSDELWTFGDRVSEGMQAELNFAKENYIRIHNMPEPEALAAKLYNGLKKQFENNEREVFYL